MKTEFTEAPDEIIGQKIERYKIPERLREAAMAWPMSPSRLGPCDLRLGETAENLGEVKRIAKLV